MVTESAELLDNTAARIEAAKRVGTLLTEHANQLWADQDWQLDATNGQGLILYTIQICATKSATPLTQP